MDATNYKIVVDTREQKPLWTSNVVVHKLDVGDYSIDGLTNDVAIERKSLPDLFGTLGKGRERFKRELERAQKLKYFAIVIDGTIQQCLNKDFEGGYQIKMRGDVVLKILCTLSVKYGIHFFFSGGRNSSKRLIRTLFNSYKGVYK